MPYGLLPTGFAPKTVEVVIDELTVAILDRLGIDASDPRARVLGQIVGIFAERVGLLWEIMEAVYSAQDPDKATGAALDALAALTGTMRDFARPSTVTLTLVGEALTLVAAGSQARAGIDSVFATSDAATIAAVPQWQTNTAYVVGDDVWAPGFPSPRVYRCIESGTSHAATTPTAETATVADNTVTWTFLGRSNATTHGVVDVAAQALEDGEVLGLARSITTIVTAVSGWDSVINLEDAVVGRLDETDAELRIRRAQELAATNTPTVDGIRGTLLDLPGVLTATVFNNPTDVTNADGMPPHSVEALVQGGIDQEIFDTLLATVAAGIATHGTETGSAEDSQGISHAVKFSRPVEIEIYVHVTYVYDPLVAPADHMDQVKAAVVAFGNAGGIGKDAVAVSLGAQAFRVAGVLDVPPSGGLGGCLIDTAASPGTDANIVITSRQLAVYDVARVTVSPSTGTP
jgi:uncharacterized phage protein gp47/JayE